jgi:hypothetical protein
MIKIKIKAAGKHAEKLAAKLLKVPKLKKGAPQ